MRDDARTGMVAQPGPPAVNRSERFEDFYASELGRLVALARSLAPPALAEGIAQEAMLIAYRRWREVRELERPELWVRRTCANLAVSQFRRRLIELRASVRLAARPQEPPELSVEAEGFWAAVRRLPPRQAQAAALRYVYDMPVLDIAETLDCADGTVKQHLGRARRALADALAVTGAEDES